MKKLKIGLVILLIIVITGCSKGYTNKISYDDYEKLIDNKESFILELMKDDCTACQSFKPKLKEVADEYKIEIKYINTDDLTTKQLESFGISGTPTVIFYIDGKEESTAARINGNVSKDKIISKFKASGFIEE